MCRLFKLSFDLMPELCALVINCFALAIDTTVMYGANRCGYNSHVCDKASVAVCILTDQEGEYFPEFDIRILDISITD